MARSITKYDKRFSRVGSSIDGVMVQISQRFLPPPKVTLPMNFEVGNPSEVLFMEYDFELENKVLQWTETQKFARQEHMVAENESVESDGEDELVVPSEESLDVPSDSERHRYGGEDPDPRSGSIANGGETITITNSVTNGHVAAEERLPEASVPAYHGVHSDSAAGSRTGANPFLHGLSMDILVPTPILTSGSPADGGVGGAKEVSSGVTKNGGSTKPTSFNISDFETEQDPFDNMEMRTLNDLEELNKVLQNSQARIKPVANGNDTQAVRGDGTATGNSGCHVNAAQQVVSYSTVMSNGHGGHSKDVGVSIKDVDYPDLDSLGSSTPPSQNSLDTRGFVTSNPDLAPTVPASSAYGATAQQMFYPAPRVAAASGSSYQSGSYGAPGRPSPEALTAFLHGQQSGFKPVTAIEAGYGQAGTVNFTSHGGANASDTSRWRPIASDGLHGDPYRGHSRVTYGTEGADLGVHPLRPCKSVPDMTELFKPTPAERARKSHTPPPGQRSGSPGPRRNSFHQAWNPLTSLPPSGKPKPIPAPRTPKPTPAPRTAKRTTPPSLPHSPSTSREPSPRRSTETPPLDPYRSMSRDAQRLVDSIADMGFPRARVARAVEKLGEDDKKVVDHLCAVSRLVDLGYEGSEAATALFLLDGKTDKAATFLKLLKQFRQLGFTHDKVQQALLATSLDEEKTLDELTGNG